MSGFFFLTDLRGSSLVALFLAPILAVLALLRDLKKYFMGKTFERISTALSFSKLLSNTMAIENDVYILTLNFVWKSVPLISIDLDLGEK